MSPRPRTVSDDRIFAATARAVTRLGPARLTLADVANEVGLTAAALVQRFGSKRKLLLAFVRRGAGAVADTFVTARASHASPLDALASVATSMAQQVRTPNELANSLAFLQIDLSDPDFRRPALAHSKQVLAGYEALLRDAIAAGELIACDVSQVARAIQALVGGSMINWAIHRDGTLASFVRRDLDTLLLPLSPRRSRARPKVAGRAKAPVA